MAKLNARKKTGAVAGDHGESIEDQIRRLHGEIGTLLQSSLEKAATIGELLTRKKAELEHGQFTPWIEENLPFGDRMARKYMRVYEHRNQIENGTTGSDLGVTKLLETVKTPKKPPTAPRQRPRIEAKGNKGGEEGESPQEDAYSGPDTFTDAVERNNLAREFELRVRSLTDDLVTDFRLAVDTAIAQEKSDDYLAGIEAVGREMVKTVSGLQPLVDRIREHRRRSAI